MKMSRIVRTLWFPAVLLVGASTASAEECFPLLDYPTGTHVRIANEKSLDGKKQEACAEMRIEFEGLAARRAKLKELSNKCAKEEAKELDFWEKIARESSSALECRS